MSVASVLHHLWARLNSVGGEDPSWPSFYAGGYMHVPMFNHDSGTTYEHVLQLAERRHLKSVNAGSTPAVFTYPKAERTTMSHTNKKKGSKWKQFKGDPGLYVVHIYTRDGVKKTVKQIMKRRARRKNKLIGKDE